MTLLRRISDDMHLQQWLSEESGRLRHILRRHVPGLLACLEMIRSGTVAFNDMFFMKDAARAMESQVYAPFSHGIITFGTGKLRLN